MDEEKRSVRIGKAEYGVETGKDYVEVLERQAHELSTCWMQNIENLSILHPRVGKKLKKSILKWAKTDNFEKALYNLAKELLVRRQKDSRLLSVKIALSLSQPYIHLYGSAVKLYYTGKVIYRARNCFSGLSFIIYDGEEIF